MKTRVRVLLHICSNITENPKKISESGDTFGAFRVLSVEGNYREIEDYRMTVELVTPNDLIKLVSDIPFQSIANQLTKDFGCADVYVQPPKITPRGIFVNYCRGESEQNMLFLKIVFEESG